MKKLILCMLLAAVACQLDAARLRVAVVFDTDSVYTLLGPLSTKTVEVNLQGTLYKQMELLADTSSFELKLVSLPEELSATNNPNAVGIPKKSSLSDWMKRLRKKEPFDLLLMVYKPVQVASPYGSLEGLSYGLNTSKGYVYSLNNALIFNAKTMDILAATTIESEADFLAGSFELDKSLPADNSKNMEAPLEMIVKLNQDFALKVFQCLQMAKRKMN